MDRDIIYDKMRVACKREKKVNLVALYGLLSLAARCEGLYYQKRKSELRTVKSKATWQAYVDQLLVPKELKDFRKQTLDECLLFADSCTEDAFRELEKKLSAILA